MRKVLFAVAGVGLLLVVMAPVVVGDGARKFEASLNGYLEVPSISSNARGSFKAEIKSDRITYRLRLRDFAVAPLFAHIHFARPDVNGGVAVFLCGGGNKPACPASGLVTGTLVAADVIGPAAQGIEAGEFAELVRAIRNGATYVNVHTPAFPGGEIRGNIHRD
jgi:hypothetical protein